MDDLSTWLERQREHDLSDLERALGMEIKPEKSVGFAGMQFPNAVEAQKACNKLNAILGVKASQNYGRLIIQPDTHRSQIDALAKQEGWTINWYSTRIKG